MVCFKHYKNCQVCFSPESSNTLPARDSVHTRLRSLAIFIPKIIYSIKPGFHIIAGIAEIARIDEKFCSAIPAIIWKPNFSDVNDPSDRSDHDRWDRTRFYLSDRSDRDSSKNVMEITFSDRSDASDRNLKVDSVFTQHVLGAKLTLVIISCI